MSNTKLYKVSKTIKPLKSIESVNYGCTSSPKLISPQKQPMVFNFKKYFDKRLNNKPFGTNLKSVINDLKNSNIQHSAYLKKPLLLKQYYYLLANPYIDENGEIIPIELYNVQLRYMAVLYSNDPFVQQWIFRSLENGNIDVIPYPEYTQLQPNEAKFLLLALDNKDHNFIFWDFFKSSLNKQDYEYYIEQCLRFLTNPFLNPQNNKKWKSDTFLPDEQYFVSYPTFTSFLRTLRLSIPFLRILQLQDVIINEQKNVKRDIFNLMDNGFMCITSSRYMQMYSYIAVYKLFLQQVEPYLNDETRILLFESYELKY